MGIMHDSTRALALVGLGLLSLWTAARGEAAVEARYVRVENPTGMYMEWREVEVFSGGANIVAGHEDWIVGSHWYDVALARYASAMLDGTRDVDKRGTDYANGLGNKIDAWFELDLGKPTAIDKINLYGGSYPNRQFGDKGNRLITLLDAQRRVIWAAKWDYFDSKTAPAIAQGVFTFAPQTGAEPGKGVVGMTVPPITDCLEWAPMSWLLGTQEQVPPAGAAQRLAAFRARDAAGLAPFAAHFFDLIEPDVAELAAARKLHEHGDDLAALEEWKKYFFAKIARFELGSATEGGAFNGAYKGIADDLARCIRLDLTGNAARMVSFVPGQIDWLDPAMGTDNKYVEKFTGGLLEAYAASGDTKYLRRWAEIMDDWSNNFFAQADTASTNVKNLFVFCEVDSWMGLLGKLQRIARARPEMVAAISATTLARMQVACLEQYGPAYWRPVRDMLFGHASSAIALWRGSLPTFDEFGPGRRIAKEWRQHFERWMTMCTHPDGLMVGNEDEAHMIIPFQLGATIAACEQGHPAWYTPGVRNRTLAWLDEAHRDIFRHPTPGGYDHRFGSQGISWDRFIDLVKPYGKKGFDRSAVIYAIPEVRRILGALGALPAGRPAQSPTAPAWENQLVEVRQKLYDGALAVLGSERPVKPVIDSDWMPYNGSYYFRSGWDRDDAFLSMLARTTHGAMMAEEAGQYCHYDHFFPLMHGDALKINGCDRLANTAFPRRWTKHAQMDIRAENVPEPLRWHSSARYDFGEAEFTGRFQNEPEHPALSDVRETRQVLQVRGERLFIVTDLTAFLAPGDDKRGHDFALGFSPALSHLKSAKAPFADAQLSCDAAAKSFRTANPDGPNEAVYQFTDAPLTYNVAPRPLESSYRARFGDQYEFSEPTVTSRWTATGNAALVTLVSSSPAGGKEGVTKVEALNGGTALSGFKATLADGGTIWYQVAAGDLAALTCGDFTVKARSLLVQRDAKGACTGVVLDGTGLKVAGKAIALPAVDAEFAIQGGALVAAQPIYRPIDPVRFAPDVNAFVGSQVVTLASATPQVEIRYTTDGTQPTPASPLYTKPFTITETTEIAARAYRLVGGKRMDFDGFEINGTRFSQTTYGWFYKKALQDAVALTDADKLVPGLDAEQLEGTWTALYADAHWMRPVSVTPVAKEMDLSAAYNTDDAFGVRYQGYLRIPSDGLYTFHAPAELTGMTCSASYDYRLYIDGEEWDLTQWFHGRSTWSVGLKAGNHRFELDYANARIRPWRIAGLWEYGDYPSAWVEHEGPPSPLLVSGPGLDHQPLPSAWLFRREAAAKPAGAIEAPSQLVAKARSYVEVDLDWAYAGHGQSGFRIERAVSGLPFTTLATVGPEVRSYQDRAGISLSTNYHYRMRAVGQTGESAFSNGAHATTGGSDGVGLHGDYFAGADFAILKKSRLDTTVDFEWSVAPPDPSLSLTDYSVRWTGKVQPTSSGTYTFHTTSDDGVRLWVDGKLLIDKWVAQGGNEWTGTIDLVAAGMYDLKLEYFQGAGNASVRLFWTPPGRTREIIPKTQLFPAAPAK